MVGWQRCLRSAFRQIGNVMEHQNRQAGLVGYCTLTKSYLLPGHLARNWCASGPLLKKVELPCWQHLQHSGISSSKNLCVEEDASLVPMSSPLTPIMGDTGKINNATAGPKKSRVQAIKTKIRMSPKKLNLVAKLVRGMRVEDALLQLQVTVKRAAKTVYQVIHSARANASHNHGLDPDRLLVDEAFVGKGLYLKRLSIQGKSRCSIEKRPYSRLTVIVRETTPEEEAKIAKLRVSNFKKLTKREKQLVPHQLIEATPRWGRKKKETMTA